MKITEIPFFTYQIAVKKKKCSYPGLLQWRTEGSLFNLVQRIVTILVESSLTLSNTANLFPKFSPNNYPFENLSLGNTLNLKYLFKIFIKENLNSPQ